MRPLRLGVVGLGAISRFYLAAAAALPGVEPAAVCDVRPAALEPHRGRVRCHSDHRAMLDGGGLDAVVVTVPNDAHADVCADAVTAGLPVCVEKPLALTTAAARDVDRLARRHGVPVLTAFHRRHNAHVLALRDRVAAGPPIGSVRVRYRERIEEHAGADTWYLDPLRCGGGCVADNGPNAFDLVRLLLGDVEVVAAGIGRDASGVDRRADVVLRAASGARADVLLDWSYDGEAKDVEVRLADGTVHRADMLAGYPAFKASLWHEYRGVLRRFAGIIAGGGAGGGVHPDGFAALELVEAAYRLGAVLA